MIQNGTITGDKISTVYPFYILSDGDVLINGNCSAITFQIYSDYRIKDNISEINETIDALKPVMYRNKLTDKYDMGFIAHELQEVFPCLVNGEKDDVSLQSVHYTGLIALLVKELKELKLKFAISSDNINNKIIELQNNKK